MYRYYRIFFAFFVRIYIKKPQKKVIFLVVCPLRHFILSQNSRKRNFFSRQPLTPPPCGLSTKERTFFVASLIITED